MLSPTDISKLSKLKSLMEQRQVVDKEIDMLVNELMVDKPLKKPKRQVHIRIRAIEKALLAS